MVNFGEILKTWKLQSNSVTRQAKNWWKMPKFKNSNETFWWFSNIVEFTFWLFWCICRPENLQRVTRLKSFRSLEKSLISWFKIGTVYYVTGWRHHERFVYLKKNRLPQKQTILESKQENCIEIAFFAYGQKIQIYEFYITY